MTRGGARVTGGLQSPGVWSANTYPLRGAVFRRTEEITREDLGNGAATALLQVEALRTAGSESPHGGATSTREKAAVLSSRCQELKPTEEGQSEERTNEPTSPTKTVAAPKGGIPMTRGKG